MKGQITLTFTAKEAISMLATSTSKSLTRKIVTAFQAADVTPAGAKNSVVARAKTATKKTAAPRKRAAKTDEASTNEAHVN